MAFKAILQVEDTICNVLQCSFEFEQELDQNGRPSTGVRGGIILLTIEYQERTDLAGWMINPTKTKSGKVLISNRDNAGKLVSLDFEDAYCTRMHGNFESYGEQPFVLTLKLSAKNLTFDNEVHENNWPSYQS